MPTTLSSCRMARRVRCLLLAMAATAATLPCTVPDALAQDCTDCPVYAATELNLRQDPATDSAVLRIVPEGGEVVRAAGAETNGYVPVTYDQVPGWVVVLGLVASPAAVGGSATSSPPTTSVEERVTLAPLVLRSGPAPDAEPVLVMPEGATVTLTGEGAEGGYVTVDYDGSTGWAYADLLTEASAS
ncbi:MAG: SH3 domain-containing protein [Thermomicrobiales bacterium]